MPMTEQPICSGFARGLMPLGPWLQVLLEHAGGSDLAPLLAGHRESGAHAHSRAAYETLEQYRVGRLSGAGLEHR